jgi:SAM-dependent methyltransferase
MNRTLYFLMHPSLLYFFVAIRISRVITSLIPIKIDLTTSEMHSVGIGRFSKEGSIYYMYMQKSYPESVATGNAVDHIKSFALEFCKGKGLDIGSKYWPLDGAIGVDNLPHENAYKLDRWDDEALDYIFSSHCLEHLSDWQSALNLWSRKIKQSGIIFLYLPHESMSLWAPGSPWVGADHVWSPTCEIVTDYLKKIDLEIIESTSEPDDYFSFYIIARKK